MFFDLINRLSGREGVIHGAIRHPKTAIQIQHNFRRVVGYLMTFERYQHSTIGMDYTNDVNAFWMLQLDIKNLFLVPKVV